MPSRPGRSSFRREIADVPASPPPHVLRDVDHAARRVEELRDDDRELHFELDADLRVVVEVRDLCGHVVRAIRPSEALELLSGHNPPRTWKVP
jgi:hypothetical protein